MYRNVATGLMSRLHRNCCRGISFWPLSTVEPLTIRAENFYGPCITISNVFAVRGGVPTVCDLTREERTEGVEMWFDHSCAHTFNPGLACAIRTSNYRFDCMIIIHKIASLG